MGEKCQKLDSFIKTKQMYAEQIVRALAKEALTSDKPLIAVR